MRVKEHFYRNAEHAIPSALRDEVIGVLKTVDALRNDGTRALRQKVLDKLQNKGWSDSARIHNASKISVTSMKENIALCLQTGNMSRFYADLLKLETLFRNGSIKGAIYVLPTKTFATELGSNIANFERLVEELGIFYVTLSTPILVLGITKGN